MHITIVSAYIGILSAIALASATAAASASFSDLPLATPSIASNVTGTVGGQILKSYSSPKSYHIPNTPITLLFTNYDTPPGLTPTSVYQALLKSLYAVYYNSQPPKTAGSFIGVDAISWTFGGVNIRISNYNSPELGRMLTWGVLADMIEGVGTFLEIEGCLRAQWAIMDSSLGVMGSGSIGGDLSVAGGNVSAAAVVEAA